MKKFVAFGISCIAVAAIIVSCNQGPPSDSDTAGMVGGVDCGPTQGAIFTTESVCDGTNLNIFGSKDAVYLDGGPHHPGSAGLPDGYYYVQVTEPNGTLLGTSVGSATPTPVHVTGGEFDHCYQLSDIVYLPPALTTKGYNTTGNAGGEYKVWVSQVSTFQGGCTKTDNFKVKTSGGGDPETATLCVQKFYDANANGLDDDGQQITGWKVRIANGIDLIRFTPQCVTVEPGTYTVTEFDAVEPSWVHTTPTSVQVTLANGDNTTVIFGNLCLGGGGGKTLGFWSNKNGQATMNDGNTVAPELTMLSNLCLRNADGSDFNPTTYAQFRTWILNANAVNMAYMLSAQLAAMQLNIEAGFVSGNALVYAPGCGNTGVGNNFITITNLVAAADAALCSDGNTPSGDPNRASQECLKNVLDKANNNLNFVQAAPCPFTFAP